jgi:hypothetical protein
VNSFDRNVLKYCQEHPEDPNSQYFLKSFAEESTRRKAEKRRWSLIAQALENYETREKCRADEELKT